MREMIENFMGRKKIVEVMGRIKWIKRIVELGGCSV
jgi:hypothetical protein